MNWYKNIKVSSITFELGGAFKRSKPKTLDDISYNLQDYINARNPELLLKNDPYSTVSPDGGSDEIYTGVINCYFDPKITNIQDFASIINEWIKDIALLDIGITKHKIDKSKLYQGLNVLRLMVNSNGTQDIDEMPSMNLSNDNAVKILSILGKGGYAGSLNLIQIKPILDNILKMAFDEFELSMTSHIRPQIDTHNIVIPPDATIDERKSLIQQQNINRQKARVMDSGLDAHGLRQRLDSLSKMVNYGLSNGFKVINWS